MTSAVEGNGATTEPVPQTSPSGKSSSAKSKRLAYLVVRLAIAVAEESHLLGQPGHEGSGDSDIEPERSCRMKRTGRFAQGTANA